MSEWIWRLIAASSLILISAGLFQNRQETHLIRCAKTAETHLEKKLFENQITQDEEDVYARMREINPDFRALLEFESGLIKLPVVQTDNNSWYLDHLFDGSQGISGTLFFDMQCEKDDALRIIYGHSVFSEPEMMFTPLHQLCAQDFFEQNRVFTLNDGETEEVYEIISVFINDEACEDALDTRIRSFMSESDAAAFMNSAISRSLVHTDGSCEYPAKALILQTCMDMDSLRRLCVLAVRKEG